MVAVVLMRVVTALGGGRFVMFALRVLIPTIAEYTGCSDR